MARLAYPTDLTDAEWALAIHYVPRAMVGCPYTASTNCSTPFFINCGLVALGLLPYDLPHWRSVYKQFEAWREDGI